MFRLLLPLIFAAHGLCAGPWPQDRGTWFTAGAVRLTWPGGLDGGPAQYTTMYLEYGLTPALTLGLDLGHGVSGKIKRIAFLRYPLWAGREWRVAGGLGLGTVDGRRIVRPMLSMGRGFATEHGWGWFTADGAAEIDRQTGEVDVKLDVTLGFPLANERKVILQVQGGKPWDADVFLRLAPSYVRPLGRNLKLETGLALGLTRDAGHGVMIGVWRDF